MSSEIVIRVDNLCKCYQVYGAPRDRLKQFVLPRLTGFAGRPLRQYFREFWALKGVSLEVMKGETVGIIGRNGSGKSTLLQVVCGTLHPTSGSIQTRGRIAALLELGSGFNPEFTGRENVYMNGAVLGLSERELDARFDDIAAFADIGGFIEQPVKTYSSGMVVRLAFAVAINVEPQILVVDEALSVGDELFQRKCFSRIEAIKRGGATILFVSHSANTVVELCDRAVLLESGEKLASGVPKQVVGLYQKLLYSTVREFDAIKREAESLNGGIEANGTAVDLPENDCELSSHKGELREFFDPNLRSSSIIEYESRGARIESPAVFNLAGEQVNHLVRGGIYHYVYTVRFTESASRVRFGMLIKTLSGVELGGAASASSPAEAISLIEAGSSHRVQFRFCCALNPGVYFLNAGVTGEVNGTETFLHRVIDIAIFKVLPDKGNLSTGTIDFGCTPEVSLHLP